MDEFAAERGLPQPEGLRRLTPESRAVVEALAGAIAAEVDRLIAARWSRTAGAILEADPAPKSVSTSACACGSGIPVTTVELDGRTATIMALEPILEMAHKQGLRADAGLPAVIWQTAQVYNDVAAEDEAWYSQAVGLAWQAYCAQRSSARAGAMS